MEQTNNKPDIRQVPEAELLKFLNEYGEKPFRLKQLRPWLWKHFINTFDEIKNMPSGLLNALTSTYLLTFFESVRTLEDMDGTEKTAFRLAGDTVVEGVLIPAADRLTACLSTQAGCPVGCAFCATGKMGFKRNLTASEMYAQFVSLNRRAVQEWGRGLTNIVLMGMGEPLLNYEQVVRFITMINTSDGHSFSARRITLSTVGIPQYIKRLADDSLKVNLAVSLHAPTNEKRNALVPLNKTYPIEMLIEALMYYYKKTKQTITFEYVLLRGINDGRTDAVQLAALCRQFPSKVNIIEFNSFEGVAYQKPEAVMTGNFCRILKEQGVNCTLRQSKGSTINAACGQLSHIVNISY